MQLFLEIDFFNMLNVHGLVYHSTGTWTVDSLSSTLESQPSIVRRHLGFWVSQGILKEQSTDTFTVVERLQEGTKTTPQGVHDSLRCWLNMDPVSVQMHVVEQCHY